MEVKFKFLRLFFWIFFFFFSRILGKKRNQSTNDNFDIQKTFLIYSGSWDKGICIWLCNPKLLPAKSNKPKNPTELLIERFASDFRISEDVNKRLRQLDTELQQIQSSFHKTIENHEKILRRQKDLAEKKRAFEMNRASVFSKYSLVGNSIDIGKKIE